MGVQCTQGPSVYPKLAWNSLLSPNGLRLMVAFLFQPPEYMDHMPVSPRLVTLRVYFNHLIVAGYLKLFLYFHYTMPHITSGHTYIKHWRWLTSSMHQLWLAPVLEQDMKMFQKTTLLPRKAGLLYIQGSAFQEQNCSITKAPFKGKCAIFPYICVFIYVEKYKILYKYLLLNKTFIDIRWRTSLYICSHLPFPTFLFSTRCGFY